MGGGGVKKKNTLTKNQNKKKSMINETEKKNFKDKIYVIE